MDAPRCAVLPAGSFPELEAAVAEGGGIVSDVADAEALIWTGAGEPAELREVLDAHHRHLRWVQLPWAGLEPYAHLLDGDRTWTCGKGVYAEPVAEHALALALGGMRGIGRYARERRWSEPYGYNLFDAQVCILGGGQIARSLARLLEPFGARVTAIRKRVEPIPAVADVLGIDRLHDALETADLVVLALALTPETEHVIDASALAAMQPHAWLVNVARGRHIDTDALVVALRAGELGGAALDVTEPEPLPDDHPLWSLPNAIVTPHVGNTPEMRVPLLRGRVRDNVARFARGDELLGPVYVELGY